MVLQNRDLSDDEEDHDSIHNLKGNEQDKGDNTGKGKKHVRLDQCSEDNDTRALERLPMCSRKEFAMELVCPLFVI